MGFEMYLQKPLWDPSNFTYSGINFNNFMNSGPFCGFQTPLWQTSNPLLPSSSSSSSTNTANESYEDWKKRKRAEQEQKALKNEFLKEQQEEINKTKDLIEAQSKMIDAVKKGKKSDGSTVVESAKLEGVKLKEDGTIDKEAMKPKKKGFWGKCGEWLSSAGSTIANMGKALICWDDKKGGINWKRMAGFDENGKWRPWKSPTLVAAVAVGACFIPVAGPFIGGALCAYGVGSGAVGVYKGVKKLNNARTEEEKEQARQDVCSGTITGLLSIFGLRGIGKTFRGSSTTASTSASSSASGSGASAASGGTAVRGASLATPRTGFFGKTVQYTSQFGRDITVNAYRGIKQAAKSDLKAVSDAGGGFNGIRKAYGQKVSDTWKGFNSWEKRYDKQYANMENSTRQRIADIDKKIDTINRTPGSDKSLRTALYEERNAMVKQLSELKAFKKIKTKADFDTLKETCNKDFKKLIQLKENVMRVKAKHPDKYTSELADYIPNPNVKGKWWKPSTWRKNKYQLAIGGKNPGKWGEITGLVLTSPASSAYLSAAQWNRDYSVPMFGNLVEMTPEQTEDYLKQLEQEKRDLEKALENITNIKDTNEWNQLKAQAQAQAEAQREAAEKAAQETAAQQQC